MTYREAMAWCFEYQCEVQFFIEQGQHRVTVRASGFPNNTATRGAFIEAVEAVKKQVERLERARGEEDNA